MAWAPAAAAGASALGSVLGYSGSKQERRDRRNARNQAIAQSQQYAKDYGDYQKNLSDMFAEGTDMHNLLFGPQETTRRESSTRSGTSTTTPTITDQFAPDVANVQGILRERLRGPGVPAGYEASQIRNINRNADAARQRIANVAAAKGLSGDQVAALSTPVETNTAEQIADFQANLPLMARQMQTEDLGLTSQLAQQFGRGQTQNYSDVVNSVMSQVSPADLSAILAYLREVEKPLEPTYFPA